MFFFNHNTKKQFSLPPLFLLRKQNHVPAPYSGLNVIHPFMCYYCMFLILRPFQARHCPICIFDILCWSNGTVSPPLLLIPSTVSAPGWKEHLKKYQKKKIYIIEKWELICSLINLTKVKLCCCDTINNKCPQRFFFYPFSKWDLRNRVPDWGGNTFLLWQTEKMK